MVNIKELNEKINQYAEEWGASGVTVVYKDGEIYQKGFYGLGDREKNVPITKKSNYLISFNSRFIMGLCIGMLIDEKKLKLGDKLDKLIPEYTYASKITINQLCLKQSGIPDFFSNGIMKEQQMYSTYQSLNDKERNIIDRKMSVYPWTFGEAIAYANENELTCVPGTEPTDDLDNMAETLFIREVIERASGINLPSYVRSKIFAPLDIIGEYSKVNTKPYAVYQMDTYMNSEYDIDEKYTFTIDYNDAEKLMVAIVEKRILSEKAWIAITKPATFEQSIIFNSVAGFLSGRDFGYGNLGWSYYLYIDWDSNMGLLHLTNSELIVRHTDGKFGQFRKAFREEVAATFVFPKDTKLVPFGKNNVRDAMQLSINDEQLEYMMSSQEAICIAYAYKHKLFILMEGNRSIGLVAFSMDNKSKKYYIESVLIDKKYQQRGFGKIMMINGLEYLKSQGCNHLSIGVNRFNLAAQNLYKSVGFKEKTIYEDFIELETYLD